MEGNTRKSLKIVDQAAGQSSENGVTRRDFLKILGTASAMGAVGCADSAHQNIFPYAKGEDTQVPGVAVWYHSTCTECSAGCGIKVRTREGRAVKVEGNPDHPVNRGGLCALGQSSLQHLYDPDRVRQPLKRERSGNTDVWKPISWDEAYAMVSDALTNAKGKRAIVTGDLHGGADEEITREFASELNADHVVFDSLDQSAHARAAELAYGVYGIPEYAFDKADLIVNFGADFLETWVSPCGYARDWAKGRKRKHPAKFIHIEPRLSLTGANADKWIASNPGSEVRIALVLLKLLQKEGKGDNLSSDVQQAISGLVSKVKLEEVAKESGVPAEKILMLKHHLEESHASLVLAGGTTGATADPLPLLVAVNLLNLMLGNVGTTVKLKSVRVPKTKVSSLTGLIDSMRKGEVDVLFTYNTNPAFSVPVEYGYQYSVGTVGTIVSFSSHLDETARLAHLVLPSHTALESWGDVRPLPGVYGLRQPVMSAIFSTKAYGDILMGVASKAGASKVGGGATSFDAYLKKSWEKVSPQRQSFEVFWRESVERGGYFDTSRSDERIKVKVDPQAYRLDFEAAKFDSNDVGNGAPILFPYISVRSFDGRAANRPWLQELPDPVTKVVWDNWAEVHPETAKKFGLHKDDMIAVKNRYGELNVPVYITDYIRPGVVAVPLGQGHSGFGRYADSVPGGNAYGLLQKSADSEVIPLLSTRVKISRGPGRAKLVNTQGSDSQMGRELARTKIIGDHHEGGHGEGHGHGEGEHHERPQMYTQRDHPIYQWGLAVDLAACTGCSACVVACYAENNIPVVGKRVAWQGREMSWLRIERYYDGSAEELTVHHLPMMCQHCQNAPCEPVCPVYATYHNEEGLNSMVYNRCVGTRYCANNCSYKVRRFNWFEFDWPETLNWQLNPDVTKRTAGVMEKCTFCVQRINEGKDIAKDEGRLVRDGDIQPACVQSCPTQALTFGNLKDPNSKVSKLSKRHDAYKVLDHHLNTQPSISYLEDVKYKI